MTKYQVDLPYPKIKVKAKNLEYAKLLHDSYSGIVSEMTAVNQYAYHHLVCENINKKIAELEDLITRVVIIDPSTLAHDKISFGSTMKLIDVATDEEITYTIVSSSHSNPDEGKISFHSPLAKQLLGKSVGDECIAQLPGGKKEFEIEEVYYDEDRIC